MNTFWLINYPLKRKLDPRVRQLMFEINLVAFPLDKFDAFWHEFTQRLVYFLTLTNNMKKENSSKF